MVETSARVVETSARAEPSLGGGLVLHAELITAAGKNSKIECVWITLDDFFLGLAAVLQGPLATVLQGLQSGLQRLLERSSAAMILRGSILLAGAKRPLQQGFDFLSSGRTQGLGTLPLAFKGSSMERRIGQEDGGGNSETHRP